MNNTIIFVDSTTRAEFSFIFAYSYSKRHNRIIPSLNICSLSYDTFFTSIYVSLRRITKCSTYYLYLSLSYDFKKKKNFLSSHLDSVVISTKDSEPEYVHIMYTIHIATHTLPFHSLLFRVIIKFSI